MSLLVRSPFFADESLPSLIARLTQLNSYPLNGILTLIETHLGHKFTWPYIQSVEVLDCISQFTHLPIEELYYGTIHRFAQYLEVPWEPSPKRIKLDNGNELLFLSKDKIKHHFRLKSSIQFCPECIREEHYERTYWSLRAITLCLTHKCSLIEQCPGCHARISQQDLYIGECSKCKYHLLTTPKKEIGRNPEFTKDSQALLHSLFGVQLPQSPQHTAYIFSRRAPETSLRVLFPFIHGIVEINERILARKNWDLELNQARHKIEFNREIYTSAAWALRKWPHRFYLILDEYRLRGTNWPHSNSAKDLENIITEWSEQKWSNPQFMFVHRALSDYLAEKYRLDRILDHLSGNQESVFLPYFPYVPFELWFKWQASLDYISDEMRQLFFNLQPINWFEVEDVFRHRYKEIHLMEKKVPFFSRIELHKFNHRQLPISEMVNLTGLSAKICQNIFFKVPKPNRWQTSPPTPKNLFKHVMNFIYTLKTKDPLNEPTVLWCCALSFLRFFEPDPLVIFSWVVDDKFKGYVPKEKSINELRISLADLRNWRSGDRFFSKYFLEELVKAIGKG